jgi:hypothetical protein
MARTPRTATEIISAKTLVWAANKIANSARGFARSKKIGRIVGIRVDKISTTKDTVSITISTNPVGMAFEYGSGLHDPKGAHYISIDAKNFPNLIFEGTHEFAGQIIKTPHVNHPGVAPRPFLKPAKERHREEIKAKLAEEAGKNIRLAIIGMKRK